MIDLGNLNALYTAAASVARNGVVELVSIDDPDGARFNACLQRLSIVVREGDPEHWNDLLMIARQLRWRRVTEPYPAQYNQGREQLVTELTTLAERRKFLAAEETRRILDELSDAAAVTGRTDGHPMGQLLLQSIEEVGCLECAAILVSARAAEGARYWFHELGVNVAIADRHGLEGLTVRDQAYFIGTPRLFGCSALTAPRAYSLTYIFPSWVWDQDLPQSEFSQVASGGIRPRAKRYHVGARAPALRRCNPPEDQLVPGPLWARPSNACGSAGDDEVIARRVLLAGGRAMWLDQDGGWIRTLDPLQPVGERVHMHDEQAISPGMFLVLREGETESDVLYTRALDLLGSATDTVATSQGEWKDALRSRLRALGRRPVIQQLSKSGVHAARRAPFWTARTVVRPQSDADFVLLLEWLGLPPRSYVEHANRLRKARSQAAADVREALEAALDRAELGRLQREGHIRLQLTLDGFAAIIAARVLAVSPFEELVPRHTVRIPVQDRSARWLE